MKKITLLTALCLTLSANAAQTCSNNVVASTPNSRFTTTADTVTDTQTGLIWMRCSLGQSGSDCGTGSVANYTWEMALRAPIAVNAGSGTFGQSDWRLPNIKELASIVEIRCSDPTINTTIFPNTPSNDYWSSSPYASHNDYAWGISFLAGYFMSDFYGYGKNSRVDYHVRLVRGGL